MKEYAVLTKTERAQYFDGINLLKVTGGTTVDQILSWHKKYAPTAKMITLEIVEMEMTDAEQPRLQELPYSPQPGDEDLPF